MTKRAPDTIILMVVAAACIALWQPLWSGSRTLYLWDAGTYFYPMKDLLARTVQAGDWPWWNPWIRNGLPFYANPQVGLFYPASLLFYLLPTALAFNWTVILHSLLIATGFFLWLRSTGRSPTAAGLGALAIAWGGFALSMTIYLNNLQALAWIGWTWWAWEGWLRDRTWRWLALTSAGFALEFLAGEPQVAVVTAIVAPLLAWTRRSDPERARPGWMAPVLGLGAAAAGAMALTAVQLVPTIELFGESQRSVGLTTGESLGWSLAPAQLYNLVVPRYFEAPSGLFDFRRIPGVEQPWVFTSYLGVVVVALAAAGVDLKRPGRALLWPILAAAGVFLAFGAHNPVVAALAEAVPALRTFRFPEKMLLLPAIAAPVLAAAGLDRIREDGAARARALGTVVLIAALGGLGWGVATVDALEQGFRHVFLFALLAALGLAAVRRLPFSTLAGFLTVIAVADLASVNTQVAPVATAELYAESPAVLEGLPLERLRTRSRIRTSPLGEPPGLAFTIGGIASGTHQYYQMQGMGGNLAMTHRVLAENGAEPFPPRTDDAQDAILRQLPIEHQVRYLRLQSTEWLVERSMAAEGLSMDAPIETLGLFRYRLDDPLPRAYLVERVAVEPDSIAVLNRFMAGGEDPHRVAYVSEGPGLNGDAERVAGAVRWLEGSNHSVRLQVDAPARSLLVLTDTWYPGWTVSVDGHSAPIRRVNWHFKGVYLEPGVHQVRFEYQPRGIVPAAIVSGLALLALMGVVIAGGRRGA
ncbi:MAG TPA: YfhO family protein [Gemmatimonadota bacterium]|nr:YfhO family protein [Gemmatimonadota bacterium]